MRLNMDFDLAQAAAWAGTTNFRPYDHPVVRTFTDQRVRHIRAMVGDWKPRNALDVGCGDGFGMDSMGELVQAIHGCDRSHSMLAANPARAARLTQCDAYALPFRDDAFDLVYCWELLHHIGTPEEVVAEMVRVSKHGVLLCEPNCLNPPMALFGMLYPHERGLLRFHSAYPRRLLRASGLRDVRSHTVGWFTPNRTPGWLARWFSHLPYRVPVLGMYTITVGFKA